MKSLSNYWFISFCLLWLAVFVGRKLGLTIPYFNDYLTDLLAVPVIASLGLAFQREFVERSNAWCFKPGHLVFIVAYTSLLFELFLPNYSDAFTADLMDVVMYITGGLFFWGIMNRPGKMQTELHKKALPKSLERH